MMIIKIYRKKTYFINLKNDEDTKNEKLVFQKLQTLKYLVRQKKIQENENLEKVYIQEDMYPLIVRLKNAIPILEMSTKNKKEKEEAYKTKLIQILNNQLNISSWQDESFKNNLYDEISDSDMKP